MIKKIQLYGKEEWRRSILVPIFKNKGDVQNCTNYRGIKLMSHTMKLWERVIEHRLRRVTSVTPKPIWVHAWKVDHGGDFLNTTIDGEIQGAEKVLAHGIY